MNKEIIKVMSFNIRYDNPQDGPNKWSKRKDLVYNIIKESNCDFYGLQEAIITQVHDIENQFPELGCICRSREVSTDWGESVPIFYNKLKWEVTEFGTFWHSENRYSPGSISWKNPLPRISTWCKFKNIKTNNFIVMYNTHYDYESKLCREKTTNLTISHMKEYYENYPIILTGDFNVNENDSCLNGYKYLFNDSYRLKNIDNGNTFHGWNSSAYQRIDYIFITKNINVLESKVLNNNPKGRYSSDHYPIYSILEY